VITDDRRSYRGIDILIAALHVADAIRSASEKGTVGILLPTSGMFPIAALAGWMCGKVVVPLNYLLKPEELQYVIDDCETDTIVTVGPMLEHMGFVPRVRRMIELDKLSYTGFPDARWPAAADADAPFLLMFTSGTSGKPKGVMLSHGNITANVSQVARWVDLYPSDKLLGVLPQFHSFGLTVLTVMPLALGLSAIYSARFVPHKIIRLIREHRPTLIVAIASMYNALLSVKDATPEDFSSFRFVVSGGEPLPMEVFKRFRERFNVTIYEGYGLTETAPVTNWCRPHEFRLRSVGRPLPEVRERTVDLKTGAELGPNQEGEIEIAGPNIMQGYYKLPEQTAAAFNGEWFRTGDIGRIDDDGHLFITGRHKEMMIIGGENVFPREIEEVLERHPAVGACGVIGFKDPTRGEVPYAFIELREGHQATPIELISWCRASLAGYKVPSRAFISEGLPRTPTGKILRRALRDLIPPAE